jgi:hypothetical protein
MAISRRRLRSPVVEKDVAGADYRGRHQGISGGRSLFEIPAEPLEIDEGSERGQTAW